MPVILPAGNVPLLHRITAPYVLVNNFYLRGNVLSNALLSTQPFKQVLLSCVKNVPLNAYTAKQLILNALFAMEKTDKYPPAIANLIFK